MWTLCANLKSVRLQVPDLPVTGIDALSSARRAKLKAVEPEPETVDETADIETANVPRNRAAEPHTISVQLMTLVEACVPK
jgi:hypothetical protein